MGKETKYRPNAERSSIEQKKNGRSRPSCPSSDLDRKLQFCILFIFYIRQFQTYFPSYKTLVSPLSKTSLGVFSIAQTNRYADWRELLHAEYFKLHLRTKCDVFVLCKLVDILGYMEYKRLA